MFSGTLPIFGLVPSRLIHLHDDKVLLEGRGDMLQEEIHHCGISPRQDQGSHFPLLWSHRCVDVGIFTHDLSWGARPDARGSPGSSRLTDPAKAPFILSHLQHRPLISRLARGYCCLDRLLEVFF